jgi:2-oxoglutarate dehydrogenase E2 component (dihydrolipoamide succinyltransferase)
MAGGTFTISNGGVFGSLMGTPIINLPQTAVLGLHAIKDKPVAINGKVEIRPMMYLALTYDHRLLDGREAVTFLVKIKVCLHVAPLVPDSQLTVCTGIHRGPTQDVALLDVCCIAEHDCTKPSTSSYPSYYTFRIYSCCVLYLDVCNAAIRTRNPADSM